MDCYEAVSGTYVCGLLSSRWVYRDLPDEMPKHKALLKKKKTMRLLNENRQGSLFDFIEDFTNRFPKYVDEYETC